MPCGSEARERSQAQRTLAEMHMKRAHLAEEIAEQQVRLAMPLVGRVVQLLLVVNPRAVAQILCAITDERRIL